MTYDTKRGRVIVFGGFDGAYLSDTWAWDGKSWTRVAASGPPARGGKPGLAFDGHRRRVVLFGGGIGGGRRLNRKRSAIRGSGTASRGDKSRRCPMNHPNRRPASSPFSVVFSDRVGCFLRSWQDK